MLGTLELYKIEAYNNLYLCHAQTYMQLATTKSEEIGEKMKLKERDVELWIEKNGLPKELKTKIMQKVKYKLEENKDVDVENLLSILPSEDRKYIKRLLCLPMLRKVMIYYPTFHVFSFHTT